MSGACLWLKPASCPLSLPLLRGRTTARPGPDSWRPELSAVRRKRSLTRWWRWHCCCPMEVLHPCHVGLLSGAPCYWDFIGGCCHSSWNGSFFFVMHTKCKTFPGTECLFFLYLCLCVLMQQALLIWSDMHRLPLMSKVSSHSCASVLCNSWFHRCKRIAVIERATSSS